MVLQKVQAESIVETSEIPFAIIRTCLVYGHAAPGGRSNIISWVKKNLEQGTPIKVVNDQWRTPTYVEDLAKGILLVIQKKAAGVFNIAGKDKLTPYEMALKTALLCKLDTSLIEKTDASGFTEAARRPPNTGLTSVRQEANLVLNRWVLKKDLGKC